MKKIFTLICALMGFVGAANAATVDDIATLKHSYVLVCDDLGARPGKGNLFGDNHFLDVTGGSTATNKGQVDLSMPGPTTWDDGKGNIEDIPQYITDDIIEKYGTDYPGPHYNWLRLKNAQDLIAMKLTAKSKVIMFIQGNNKIGKDARIPKISKNADLSDALNAAPTDGHPRTVSGYRWEYTVDDDGIYYVGSYNGDMFVSFIIVEANEAPGTPTVKVGDQQYENGLWFKEVTCKANPMKEEGSTEEIPTIVTYTTDGSAPTASSPLYTAPIKCYSNQTVKFQAFMDLGLGSITDEDICDGADNEVGVNFSFDAPVIEANGAAVTITSPYEGAKNYYAVNDGEAVEGSSFTLEESANVSAYSQIVNGTYATFTTKSTTKEVYVLDPIKTKQTLTMTGDKVENPDKKADTDPNFIVENGAVNHDKKFFFIRNTGFKVVEEAQYQVAGQEIYLMMNGDIITFEVAEGDSVDVVVTCSKNACKNIGAADAEDGSQVNDRKCYINVDGTNYFAKDAEGNETSDLKLYPETANIVKFGLKAGIHTFKKYSGTGNILVSSIEITPVEASGIQNVKNAAQAQDGAIYNLAGQKVDAAYKGLVIKNGKKFVNK